MIDIESDEEDENEDNDDIETSISNDGKSNLLSKIHYIEMAKTRTLFKTFRTYNTKEEPIYGLVTVSDFQKLCNSDERRFPTLIVAPLSILNVWQVIYLQSYMKCLPN